MLHCGHMTKSFCMLNSTIAIQLEMQMVILHIQGFWQSDQIMGQEIRHS